MHVESGIWVHSIVIWPALGEADDIFILSSFLDDSEIELRIVVLVPKAMQVWCSELIIAFSSK